MNTIKLDKGQEELRERQERLTNLLYLHKLSSQTITEGIEAYKIRYGEDEFLEQFEGIFRGEYSKESRQEAGR
ncbi:hypothetical protein HYW74_03480 [Candidatus Pacearchaeota archaeon]|nr:hypothetical protein [Candidatus Pacearchaeota archaeon]